MSELRAGARLYSAVDDTEVIVIRAASADVVIGCGGRPMVADRAAGPPAAEADPEWTGETPMGKRYADESVGLEVLCVRPGTGLLSVDGRPLPPKPAKVLPTSD
jgi:hypothetical protein